MSARQPADTATQPAQRSRHAAPYSVEDFNRLGDVVRECRDHAGGRRLGRLARTLIAQRQVLRTGLRLLRHLPVLELELAGDEKAEMIRTRLGGRLPGRNVRVARAALELPADRATYLRGRPKQALRTNLRHAETQGIACKTLSRVPDQEAALKAFFSTGRFTDADRVYLNEKLRVNPGQQDFYCAEDAEGQTIAVAAVVVSGSTSLLVFHHSGESEHAAIARYALTMHIISALIERGVGVLLVGSALTLDPGLRYFQQRLGFRAVNVRVSHGTALAPRTGAATAVA